jgi:hypothetical protein
MNARLRASTAWRTSSDRAGAAETKHTNARTTVESRRMLAMTPSKLAAELRKVPSNGLAAQLPRR